VLYSDTFDEDFAV